MYQNRPTGIVRKIIENYFSVLYLVFGFLGLFFFIWSGKYLRLTYPDKQNLELGFRVMMRSRHIFILRISLIEIGIGVYIQQSKKLVFVGIQWLATIFLAIAHSLFIYAFFKEVEIINIPKTPLLHYATYCVLASILLHVLTKFDRKRKSH